MIVIGDGANGERHGHALSIFGRGVQIGHGFDESQRRLDRMAHFAIVKTLALKRMAHRFKPLRPGGCGNKADGRECDVAV